MLAISSQTVSLLCDVPPPVGGLFFPTPFPERGREGGIVTDRVASHASRPTPRARVTEDVGVIS